MRPVRYYMGANKGTEVPSNLLFFDSETWKPKLFADGRTRSHVLRLWVAIALRLENGVVTRREVFRGHTPAEFFDMVDSRSDPSRPLWAFAHNLGVDLTWLDFWSQLWKRRYTIGPVERPPRPGARKRPKAWIGKLCVEARPTFIICRNATGVIKWVDSGNYWPESLAKIGAAAGLPKLQMPAWEADEEDWFRYCERDCEVCELAICDLMRWWVKENCGVFQLTAAQLALQNYRHTTPYMVKGKTKVNIVCEPGHPARHLERDAYYGARVEAFYVGKIDHQVHKVDVNSLYPAVMAANPFPRRRIGRPADLTPAGLLRSLQAYGCIARVRINARGNTYPVRRDGVQLHSTGSFWTELAGPELLRALLAGDVEAVHDAQLYSMADLFRTWVHTWNRRKVAAKRKGDAAAGQYELAKLIENSLAGKFGQHGRHWKDRTDMGYFPRWDRWSEDDLETETERHFRAIAGVAQELVEDEEPRHAFPAISAYVCAYAREFMRDVVAELPFESVYYINNDTLVCDQTAFHKLKRAGRLHHDRLGAFRDEGTYPSAEFKGANHFRLGDTWTRAGIHGRARDRGDGTLVSEQWQQLPTILLTPPRGEVYVTTHAFKETESTVKGILKPDGWVKPFWFSDEPEWTDRVPLRLKQARNSDLRPPVVEPKSRHTVS